MICYYNLSNVTCDLTNGELSLLKGAAVIQQIDWLYYLINKYLPGVCYLFDCPYPIKISIPIQEGGSEGSRS